MRVRASTAAGAVVAAFGIGVVLLGLRLHWVEEAGTAERDGYVAKAERLLEGEIPPDPFRPLLYPLLIAAATPLLGEPFTAGRLLSNLAATLLVVLAGAFAVRLSGPEAGLWAVLLTAVNPSLWILGQHASTDMVFAALGAFAWLCGLLYLEGGRGPESPFREWGPVLGSSVAFALAYFTRSNALFLLPGLLLAWWWSPRRPRSVAAGSQEGGAPAVGREGGVTARRHGLHLLVFAGAALLLRLPHWILRAMAFGHPLHDENWKNLAWKLHGYPDWSYLERVPFAGLWEVVASAPAALLAGTVRELARFSIAGSSQLLGTGLHLVLLILATWAVGRRDPRRAGYLIVCMGSFLLATAATFFTWGRLLLLVLAIANGILAAGLCELGHRAALPLRSDRSRLILSCSPARLLLGVAVLVLAAKTFYFRLPAFAALHPYREVAILRQLDRGLPAGAALAGTSPFLGRYLRSPYLALPDAHGEQVEEPARYFAALERRLTSAEVDYLVAGEVDLRDRPRSLLDPARRPVGWLEPRGCEPGVCLWRVYRGGPPGRGGGPPGRGDDPPP